MRYWFFKSIGNQFYCRLVCWVLIKLHWQSQTKITKSAIFKKKFAKKYTYHWQLNCSSWSTYINHRTSFSLFHSIAVSVIYRATTVPCYLKLYENTLLIQIWCDVRSACTGLRRTLDRSEKSRVGWQHISTSSAQTWAPNSVIAWNFKLFFYIQSHLIAA